MLLPQLLPEQLFSLLQFTDFILLHLASINPYYVILFHDNATFNQAHYVAMALHGYPIESYNLNSMYPRRKLIYKENVLVVNFLQRNQDTRLFVIDEISRFILAVIEKPTGDEIETFFMTRRYENQEREIEIHSYLRPMGFVSRYSPDFIGRMLTENELMQSLAWSAFLNRFDNIPLDNVTVNFNDKVWFHADGLCTNLVAKLQPNGKLSYYFTGFFVGLYKIIADRLTHRKMNYHYILDSVILNASTVGYLDSRLSHPYEFIRNVNHTDRKISFEQTYSYNIRICTYADSTQYRIIVPRIVETSNNNYGVPEVLSNFGIILCFLVSVLVFVTLRFKIRRIMNDIPKSGGSFLEMLFDTFSRSLGISAGIWSGRTRAERLLLSVIAVFAFLSGSIFSGALYQELLSDEVIEYRYKNLQDVCRDRLVLKYPLELAELMKDFEDNSKDDPGQCTLELYAYLIPLPDPTSAVIYTELTLANVKYSRLDFMMLPQKFCKFLFYILIQERLYSKYFSI